MIVNVLKCQKHHYREAIQSLLVHQINAAAASLTIYSLISLVLSWWHQLTTIEMFSKAHLIRFMQKRICTHPISIYDVRSFLIRNSIWQSTERIYLLTKETNYCLPFWGCRGLNNVSGLNPGYPPITLVGLFSFGWWATKKIEPWSNKM